MHEDEAVARLQRGDISGLEALVGLYQRPALRLLMTPRCVFS